MSADPRSRYDHVEARIAQACERAGRPRESVTCIAASKRQTVEKIQELYALGVRDFGESYAQELRDKRVALPDDIRWHFIGGLQSNKVPYIEGIGLVHSCDRASLIKAIGKRNTEAPQPVLIQVNLAAEAQKSGCSPEQAEALVLKALQTPGVTPVGLMNITPNYGEPEAARAGFASLRTLHGQIKRALRERDPSAGDVFTALSMGMSGDLEVAIEEGATLVRVGTALFGPREY